MNFSTCFSTVGQQVLILFLLMAVGFVCNKTHLLSKEGNKRISDLVVLIVSPCVIIQSFEREFSTELLAKLGLAAVIAVVAHILMIVIAQLVIRDKDKNRACVMRFGMVFSNAGFVAIPLQQALLGDEGVFYGAAFLVVFNICLWSYGIFIMSGDKSTITPRKLFISPGIIAVILGMILFVCPFELPYVIDETMSHISALNLPLPMLIIGYNIAQTDWKSALKDLKSYWCILLRIVLIPMAGLGIMYVIGIRGLPFVASVIALCAPVGATTTMFSEKFDRDTELSVRLVSISTLLSVITMPFIVTLAQLIA